MRQFKKKLLKLYLDYPFDFPIYLEGYKDKGQAYRLIRSFIPTDSGIEFEIGPKLVREIASIKSKGYLKRLEIDSSFEITYRVRMKNYNYDLRQLSEFYNLITKPRQLNKREVNSGIHIHTNLIHTYTEQLDNNLMISGEIRTTVNEAIKYLAVEYFHYDGSYNTNVFSHFKGNSVIYRRNYETFEYRCIPMTWDFRTLLKHLIICHAFTNLTLRIAACDIDKVTYLHNVKELVHVLNDI